MSHSFLNDHFGVYQPDGFTYKTCICRSVWRSYSSFVGGKIIKFLTKVVGRRIEKGEEEAKISLVLTALLMGK